MIRKILRAVLCTLFLLMLPVLHVCAVSPTDALEEMSIRINNPGARICASIEGTPGAWVTIELIRPESRIADAYEDMSGVFAGFDMLQIPENGELIYEYIAKEQTGVFTLRVRGEVDTMSYTGEGNIVPARESDVYYADMWSSSANVSDKRYVQNSVWLTDTIFDRGAKFAAARIKESLNTREPGRRLLFIEADISNRIVSGSRPNFIWTDESVEALASELEEFFAEYYKIGGELDGIYTDDETGMGPWSLTASGAIKGEELQNKLNGITAQTEYIEIIRPQLEERGYRFDLTPEQNELTCVANTSALNESNKEYMIWAAVVDGYKSECLRKAIFEPALKYFPNVTYANYESSDILAPYYISNAHRYYQGGNRKSAGTHSSPVLYHAQHQDKYVADGSSYLVPLTPFGEMVWLVNGMRASVLSTDEGRVMPWVNAKIDPTKPFSSIDEDMRYYYEYLIHIGMCDPDAFLFYGPAYYSGDSHEMVLENLDGIIKAMEEMNAYTNKSDARTLVTDCVPIDAPFVLSGMYTDGRNLWRITPDTSVMEEGQSFCTDTQAPTFYINGITITFPEGTILPSIHADVGYWIETASDVHPVITTDTPTVNNGIILKKYDKNGIVIEDGNDAEVHSVALYVNNTNEGNTSDLSMNIAEYDNSGLNSLTPLPSLYKIGTWGQRVFHNFKKQTGSKLFIWKELGSLIPITPALPWNGRE